MTSAPRPADAATLRRSYARFAPLYDLVADRALRRSRARSLAALPSAPGARLLVPGAGTGVVLHLVLAVVPDARAAFAEAARAVLPGGRLAVLDKFVRAGERPGLVRRVLDRLLRDHVTGVLLRFEDALATAPSLSVLEDEAALLGGAYCRIVLRKEVQE